MLDEVSRFRVFENEANNYIKELEALKNSVNTFSSSVHNIDYSLKPPTPSFLRAMCEIDHHIENLSDKNNINDINSHRKIISGSETPNADKL